MLEKYFGRTQNPKVNINAGPMPEVATQNWQKQAEEDSDFREWFSGSVVSDSEGNPIPVFHARRGDASFENLYKKGVSELGVHFGTVAAANARLTHTFGTAVNRDTFPERLYEAQRDCILRTDMDDVDKQEELSALKTKFEQRKSDLENFTALGLAGEEVLYPVFLRILKPVRVTDPGSFTQDRLGALKRDLVRNFVTKDEVSKIQPVRTIEELKRVLIDLGYDGVVYRNDREGKDGDAYIPIVGPDQIRSVFAQQSETK